MEPVSSVQFARSNWATRYNYQRNFTASDSIYGDARFSEVSSDQQINIKITNDSPDSFLVHFDPAHFRNCQLDGNSEVHVADITLFLPLDQKPLSGLDNPPNTYFSAALRRDAAPVAFTTFGQTFTFKANDYLALTTDGRLLAHNSKVDMTLNLSGSSCAVTASKIEVSAADTLFYGTLRKACDFSIGGMRINAVENANFKASLKNGLLRNLSPENYGTAATLSSGKTHSRVSHIGFRDDGSVQTISLRFGDRSRGHFYYYNSEDQKIVDAYENATPYEFCYNPDAKRFESAKLNYEWCKQ